MHAGKHKYLVIVSVYDDSRYAVFNLVEMIYAVLLQSHMLHRDGSFKEADSLTLASADGSEAMLA